jgi:soluble lytic murein transglycosylase-like protein
VSSSGGGGGGGSVAGADGLNWAALAQCESSGNPRAVNPNGHYGLYQFSLSTWRSVGGSGNPIDASPAEQTYRAKVLYKKAGAGQWSCGHHLFD